MPIQVQNDITQNMGSAISLFYPIALMNSDRNLNAVYFDVERGHAIVGFRREVANFGTMEVRAIYGPGNQVEIAKNDNKIFNGVYNYVTKTYDEATGGLLGKTVKGDSREIVNSAITEKYISAIRDKVELKYEVHLSPGTIHKFLESRKRSVGGNWDEKKINMQFTAGIPIGTAKAKAVFLNGRIQMATTVKTKSGPKVITSLVDPNNSRVEELRIQPDRVYLIQPVTFDKKTGVRTVNVLRTYKEGIRMAIQKFNMGLIRPGDRAYDVNPDKTNGITETSVIDMPFMPNQNLRMIAGSPMMTFDVDMISGLMHTLSSYPQVTMKFKDSSTGVYFVAESPDQYRPKIEAIVGPTIQYVRGRIWLP